MERRILSRLSIRSDKEENMNRRCSGKLAAVAGTLTAIILYLSIGAWEAGAISTGRVPSNSTIVPAGYVFSTGYSNATWSINSAYKDSIRVMDKRSGEGCISFVVTRNRGGTRTYTDPLTVTYSNAGQINGRSVDVRLKVEKLVQTGSSGSNIANCDGEFLCLWYSVSDVSSMKTTGTRYKLTHTTDISYEITYADNGAVVELPCFQAVADLDTFQNVASVAEGFVPVSGYDTAYLYPGSVLVQKSGGFFSPSQLETDGNDSYIKTGLYITTDNGRFKGRYYATNCRTRLLVYSQYRAGMLPGPSLEIDGTKPYEPGDTVTIDVKQKIGTFFVDTVTRYPEMVIADDIPEGLSYRSAKVRDASGRDVTAKGDLTYDDASKKVTFRFDDSFLKDQGNYDGSLYTLRIITVAEPLDEPVRTIDDTAFSVISGIEQTTNRQEISVRKPFRVEYTYVSGTDGRRLPEEISAERGAYAVSDESVYYHGDVVVRKAAPAEGTALEVKNGDGTRKGRWVLSWDASRQTVENGDVTFTGTWRYVPEPKLVIVKRLKADAEQFTASHGEPTFLFRVSGEKSGKTWYKSVTFSEEVMEAVKENARFVDEDGTCFTFGDGYVKAECVAMRLPEDDYTVEEIETLRFESRSVSARYHSDDSSGGEIAAAADGACLTISLEPSACEPEDPGFDAAYVSVLFDNIKTRWDRFSHCDVVINKLEGGRR